MFVKLTSVVVIAALCACSSPRRNTAADESLPRVPSELETARSTREHHQLHVGDQAPELSVEAWLQGDPLRSLDGGRLSVVAFWATWCAPCRSSLEHLSALQRDHEGVSIVAVAASERPGEAREARVLDYLRDNRISCAVAFDADGDSRAAWADAAGAELLPRAYLVGRDGRVLWIGHPMQLDAALRDALMSSR